MRKLISRGKASLQRLDAYSLEASSGYFYLLQGKRFSLPRTVTLQKPGGLKGCPYPHSLYLCQREHGMVSSNHLGGFLLGTKKWFQEALRKDENVTIVIGNQSAGRSAISCKSGQVISNSI